MKQSLVLIGGGGHCRSCIDVIESTGMWEIAGIISPDGVQGKAVLGYPILGEDRDLPTWIGTFKNVLVTVGQLALPAQRRRLVALAESAGASFPVIISPNAHVSRHAKIDRGTIIMHGAIVNAGAQIGANAIINTQALIEHDVTVGDFVHVSTGAIVNGSAAIGHDCFLGSHSTTREAAKVVAGSRLGAGCVVARDITIPGLYVGIPARLMHSRNQ